MKKWTSAVLAIAVLGFGSSLRADDDSNGLFLVFPYSTGLYSTCVAASFGDHIAMKLIYVCPPAEAVRGFECQIRYEASDSHSVISATFPVPAIDVGNKWPGLYSAYNYIVGFGEPLPTTTFTVLADIDIHYLTPGPLYIIFGAAAPSSGDGTSPLIMLEDYSLLAPDKFSREASIPGPDFSDCFVICTSFDAALCDLPVANEEVSWGGIKCLFK